MHPSALIFHPLRFNCKLSWHASRQPQQSTMASSGSFVCPFTLLDSHLGVSLRAAALEENLIDDRFDIEDGPLPQLGSLQVFTWEALPQIRGFLKERLALTAFLNCHCSSRCVPGSSWCSTSGLVMDFPFAQLILEGNKLTLGCECTGWEEDAIGTIFCRNLRETENLQQEIFILSAALSNFSPRSWCCILCHG